MCQNWPQEKQLDHFLNKLNLFEHRCRPSRPNLETGSRCIVKARTCKKKAGDDWPDQRSGEKMLLEAQVSASHAGDAAGDTGKSHSRLTEDRSFGTTEYHFHWSDEFHAGYEDSVGGSCAEPMVRICDLLTKPAGKRAEGKHTEP